MINFCIIYSLKIVFFLHKTYILSFKCTFNYVKFHKILNTV